MAYIWQRWMPSAFRAAGLTVVEVEGWENRGRPASTGSYDPTEGLTIHHTASTSSVLNPKPTLRLLIEGRPDLPGPLAPWSSAYDGVVYVIAAGRCNHAGKVGKVFPGTYIGQDGNAIFMGNEVDTNGTQDLPREQRHSIAVTSAVYLNRMDRSVIRLHRHQDISGTGKWDIGNISTPTLRSDANAVDLSPKDWFDMATKAELREVVDAAIDAKIDDIAKAVINRPVINRSGDGKTDSPWPLSRMVTNIERDQDNQGADLRELKRSVADLATKVEQAVAEGKSAGA